MPKAAVTIVDHPLIQHHLTMARRKDTEPSAFRQAVREIGQWMAFEATRDLPTEMVSIDTPMETMDAPVLTRPAPCLVSILRAGNGLVDGILDLLPQARVGHIGLYRDEETLQPVQYYLKLPDRMEERLVFVADPMLATGGSAAAAITKVKAAGATHVRFICLLAAPEGVATLQDAHPDVPIYTPAIDRELNEQGYILPGLGDAGDRIYGTP